MKTKIYVRIADGRSIELEFEKAFQLIDIFSILNKLKVEGVNDVSEDEIMGWGSNAGAMYLRDKKMIEAMYNTSKCWKGGAYLSRS